MNVGVLFALYKLLETGILTTKTKKGSPLVSYRTRTYHLEYSAILAQYMGKSKAEKKENVD